MSSNSSSTVLHGGSESGDINVGDWSVRVNERDAVFAGVGFSLGVLLTLLFMCVWRKCRKVKPTDNNSENNNEDKEII